MENDRRRAFLLASGALLAAPLAAFAQLSQKPRRLGLLFSGSTERSFYDKSLFPRLRELGWSEGNNLEVVSRGAEGHNERLPQLAAELVQQKVDLIFVGGDPFNLEAARKATSTIPIVFAGGYSDNVRAGVIQSLARPGGNITGATFTSADLSGKRLQFLKDVLPKLSRVGVLTEDFTGVSTQTTAGQASGTTAALQEAARSLGLKLEPFFVSQPADFEGALHRARKAGVGAMYVQGLTLFSGDNRFELAKLLIKHRLPSVANWNFMADAGFLMGYSPSPLQLNQSAAAYIDKIFRGAKPAELPVEEPTRYYLVVNLKTAKALKLTIPQSVLLRAERVVE